MRHRIGNVVEIPAEEDCYYMQLTHRHKVSSGFSHGWLCRVLPAIANSDRSADVIRAHCQERELFRCFVRGVEELRCVLHCDIPEESMKFPVFKQTGGVRPTPSSTWSFWNGEEERVTFRLPSDTVEFPDWEIVDASIIIDRIRSKWSPATEVPNECIVAATKPFNFFDYPRVDDFWANQEKYRDIIGFLRAHGLFDSEDSTSGVRLFGSGPFENDVAGKWLGDMSSSWSWDRIQPFILGYLGNPVRDAVPSAQMIAAAASILQICGVADFSAPAAVEFSALPSPPRQLVKSAEVALVAVQQRSGLREVIRDAGRLKQWSACLDEIRHALSSTVES